MGEADLQHVEQTLKLGLVALETSRVGQQKAGNADLKRFAAFEIDEQTTLAEVLTSMREPSTTASTVAAPNATAGGQPASTAPAPGVAMDAQGREMVQKLQSAQAGPAFDREYLAGQVQGHQALLQTQERYLQTKPRNREHMIVALLAQARIREHLSLLQDIQSKLG
jgi:putative membrane protein